MEGEHFILPALLAQGLCPGSTGRTEEEQGSRVQGAHTAPDPQRCLQRWHGLTLMQQNPDDLFNMDWSSVAALTALLLVMFSEGATSSMTASSHGEGRRKSLLKIAAAYVWKLIYGYRGCHCSVLYTVHIIWLLQKQENVRGDSCELAVNFQAL